VTQNRTEVDSRIILAVDAGSPIVSVALARDGEILGESQPIQSVAKMIERVAPTQARVLVTGDWSRQLSAC